MSRVPEAPAGRDGEPLDVRLDRRRFLARMTALTAAASAGSGWAPAELAADPASGGAAPAPGSLRGPTGGGRGGGGAYAPGFRPPPDPGAWRRAQASEPVELTVAQAAAAIREGRLDPRELVEAYLARIVERDGLYQAYNAVVAEAARERARTLERTGPRGPLHGVPLALKDNFYTAGIPTTANSRIFADFVPETDATAWTRLREAGAVLLGKTQMGPLATTAASTPEGDRTTVNAWAPDDPEVSPGGSSSGSATAVAAGLAAGATGTQTGGSITNPALAQGLTGLKPTLGRVSLRGVIPLTYTRDHPGPLARDAMDAALLLQVMAGPDPGDPRTLGLPPVPDLVRAATPVTVRGRTTLRWPTTVGVFPGYLEADTEEEEPEREEEPDTAVARAGLEEARARRRREARLEARRRFVATLEEVGARVVEVEPPAEWETLTSRPFNHVRLPERSEAFLRHLRNDVRLFGVSLSPWINGLLLSGTAHLRGQRARLLLLRRILDDVFDRCDVVLQSSPIPFDMVGLPLLALPVGMIGGGGSPEAGAPGPAGVPRGTRPTGVVVGGQPYAEDRLLSVAAAYQAVTEWHRYRPPAPRAVGARGSVGRPRIGVQEVMDTGE